MVRRPKKMEKQNLFPYLGSGENEKRMKIAKSKRRRSLRRGARAGNRQGARAAKKEATRQTLRLWMIWTVRRKMSCTGIRKHHLNLLGGSLCRCISLQREGRRT